MKSGVKNITTFLSLAVAFAIAMLCCFYSGATAQSATELYNQAGQSYKSKQFRQAADDYEKLLAQGYSTEAVYYNLANCYYKIDSIGKSILNYERALKLSPKDEDIIYNLRLARMKSIDNIQPVPQLPIITWWNDFISFNSSRGWGIFALISVWLFIIVYTIYFLLARQRVLNIFAWVFLFASFFSLALAIHQHQQEIKSDSAIVMVSSSYVKSAPDSGAGDLFMVHEGTRLQILDRVGEWNKIRLEDGKVGWMEQMSFEKI